MKKKKGSVKFVKIRSKDLNLSQEKININKISLDEINKKEVHSPPTKSNASPQMMESASPRGRDVSADKTQTAPFLPKPGASGVDVEGLADKIWDESAFDFGYSDLKEAIHLTAIEQRKKDIEEFKKMIKEEIKHFKHPKNSVSIAMVYYLKGLLAEMEKNEK